MTVLMRNESEQVRVRRRDLPRKWRAVVVQDESEEVRVKRRNAEKVERVVLTGDKIEEKVNSREPALHRWHTTPRQIRL